jgi:putative flippase GtrA
MPGNEAGPEGLVVNFSSVLGSRTNNLFIQLFRYTIVGGFAFMIDIGTLALLTETFHIHYLVSAGFAFTLGLITNYSLSVMWVFDKRSLSNRYVEFITFTAIGLAGLALNEFFMWFFTEKVSFHYMISKLVSTFFIYAWNFSIRKLLLFR